MEAKALFHYRICRAGPQAAIEATILGAVVQGLGDSNPLCRLSLRNTSSPRRTWTA